MDSSQSSAQPQRPVAETPRIIAQEHAAAETKRELREAIGTRRDILIAATTVFPITLFPDTITVDRSTVTVTRRTFFMVGTVLSINIKDILNITANVGPFFGSVLISTRFFDNTENKPHTIDHFRREDALRIKRIVQGFIIAEHKKIDTTTLSTKELAKMLDELGQTTTNEAP